MNEQEGSKFAPSEMAQGLPAPGGDEPPMLRQDIADEIADHLLCAARREHLQNSTGEPLTDQAAISAAIERFGEPAAVARRLWWDAMKERIMAQRILMLMAMTVAAAAVFACIVLWRSTQSSRAEQAALIESQREAMMAMLAEMKSSQKSDGSQWQSLKFRLLDEEQRPVVGTITCASREGIYDEIKASADGVAEFYLPPGSYAIGVTVGEYSNESIVLLPPGRPTVRTIICPERDVKLAPLDFKIAANTPPELAIYYIAEIEMRSRQVGDTDWSANLPDSHLRLLIDPRGRVLGQLTSKPSPTPDSDSAEMEPDDGRLPRLLPANTKLKTPVGFPPGAYRINLAMYVSLPIPEDTQTPRGDEEGIPALRRLGDYNDYSQIQVDTQAKEFDGVTIGERNLKWSQVRQAIAELSSDDSPRYASPAPRIRPNPGSKAMPAVERSSEESNPAPPFVPTVAPEAEASAEPRK